MIKTLQNLHKTFYSATFYKELVLSWKGVGLGFLFFITLIGAVNTTRVMATNSSAIFNEEYDALFETLPPLSVGGGIINIEGEPKQTYSIGGGDSSTPKLVITFDVAGEVTDPATTAQKMKDDNLFILVTKDAVHVRNLSTGLVDTETAQNMKDLKMSREEWVQLGQVFKQMFIPLGFIAALGMVSIVALVLAFAGGTMLYIVSPLFKMDIQFAACMRLAAAAAFPVAVVFSFVKAILPLIVLLWFGFAAFGLLSVRATLPRGAKPS